MTEQKGKISVNTEDIFPIIRQWLYSDQDIFLRELISNASDAISKLKRLDEIGETKLAANETFRIDLIYDSEAGTLKFCDNGIGMTTEEINKYINQIAFSGVMDFFEKYKDKTIEQNGIIGHFGLGFYSAFMVADIVEIETLSWQKDAKAAKWSSEDGIHYEIGTSDRKERGTTITLTFSEEAKKAYNGSKISEILNKYCNFMPIEIYFEDLVQDRENEANRIKHLQDEISKKNEEIETAKKSSDQDEEQLKNLEAELGSLKEDLEKGPVEAKAINNTQPLWLKKPSECTDEEYKAFYREAFNDYQEPLFWIHLNMDYPMNLKGILYFPKVNQGYESLEQRIKIYYNQVFVADNVKEIIPEFLFLLRGCIDCPDLPLNVSRSALQNDLYVQKLSSHIIRKVADKLNQLFKNQRNDYESYWKDLNIFVKYGMMKEEKFYDKVKDIVLYQTVADEFLTAAEIAKKIIIYTPEKDQLVPYIEMAQNRGEKVIVMKEEIDNQYMSYIEYQSKGELKFKRVDAELGGEKDDDAEKQTKLQDLFREVTGDEKLKIELRQMGADTIPAVIHETEENRRMQEMREQFARYNQSGDENMDFEKMFPIEKTLILNTDQSIIGKLAALFTLETEKETAKKKARYLLDLARIAQGSITAEEMSDFLKNSTDLLNQN